MPQHYDIHCHVFNKNVVIRGLVNVVQALLDVAKEEHDHKMVTHKIRSIIDNLENLMQPKSEDVFQVLDNAYNGQFVVTPLMLDLTYADDNDGNERKDRRYRLRIKIILTILKEILPWITRKLPLESRILTRELRKKVEDYIRDIEVRTDAEMEIFDDANYSSQIDDLTALAAKYSTVKPFFCVDPRRETRGKENIIQLLEKYILNGPFVGVKLYAPVGFSPTDPILMGKGPKKGVYEFCIEHDLPITVHCSNAGFACLSKELNVEGHIMKDGKVFAAPVAPHKFKKNFIGLDIGGAIHERAKTLNHPTLWALVLEKYPTLKINLAHFGGSGQLMEYAKRELPQEPIPKKDFDEALAPLSSHDRQLIESGYEKKLLKMHPREDLSDLERQKIWDTMYKAGMIDNWTKAIFDIVRNPRYINAYTDLSCFSEGNMIDLPGDGKDEKVFTIQHKLAKFKRHVFDTFNDYEKSKILYGSDYFLIRFFGAEMEQYIADFRNAFAGEFDRIAHENPERFLGIR